MKRLVLFIFLLSLSMSALATPSPASEKKEFTFKYHYMNTQLEVRRPASDYNTALASAAQDCFQFYKKMAPLTEEKGLDIIDVCANPRS